MDWAIGSNASRPFRISGQDVPLKTCSACALVPCFSATENACICGGVSAHVHELTPARLVPCSTSPGLTGYTPLTDRRLDYYLQIGYDGAVGLGSVLGVVMRLVIKPTADAALLGSRGETTMAPVVPELGHALRIAQALASSGEHL